MSEFIGARISLVSRSDIRYVGTLHEINSDDSTVSLENVKSFGTEGRKGKPEEEVGPSDQLYEYIVFRSTDVKDLRIEETAAVKENKPHPVPVDPAIVGARPRPPKAPGPPGPPGQHGPPGLPPSVPPGGPGFGYYPPHAAGWGRGHGPGPNGFGGMPYPPPLGWFPPGQEFSPGPGPWNNYAFPPGLGGPRGMYGQPHRQPPHSHAVNKQAPSTQNQAQAPGSRPTPIGSAAEKVPAAPPQQATAQATAQQENVADVKHATEPAPPAQPSASSAPPPPVESKPAVEEVKATAGSLASAAPAAPLAPQQQDANMAIASGPKKALPGPMVPAVPLPAALTAKTAQPSASKPVAQEVKAAALRDATQAAKAAVAMAMAKLESPELKQQTKTNAMDNLSKKVSEMRVQSARPASGTRGNRGRGSRSAKVDVPDADFDFASANAKFNKQDVVKEAIAGSPLTEVTRTNGSASGPDAAVATTATSEAAPYNKSRSFFDNISSEAKDRADSNGQKAGGREWRGEEQRKNMETFGQSSVDGGYRGYRGRGRGRGGRGRGGYGRGRGGGGGYRHDGPAVTP